MMTEEQFTEIVAKVAGGDGLSNEEATLMIEALAELDQRGLVAEQIVQFVLHGAEETYRQLIDDVLKEVQIRDKAKVKKIAAVGSKASQRLIAATQIYIAQMYYQQQQESAVSDADPDVLFDEPTA
jgi:hypothetical protein